MRKAKPKPPPKPENLVWSAHDWRDEDHEGYLVTTPAGVDHPLWFVVLPWEKYDDADLDDAYKDARKLARDPRSAEIVKSKAIDCRPSMNVCGRRVPPFVYSLLCRPAVDPSTLKLSKDVLPVTPNPVDAGTLARQVDAFARIHFTTTELTQHRYPFLQMADTPGDTGGAVVTPLFPPGPLLRYLTDDDTAIRMYCGIAASAKEVPLG